MNMGNNAYLSTQPHAVTRVGNIDYLKASASRQITYNGAGSLVSDAGRGIARIDYDLNNNPVRIQFTNGSVTKRQEICEMRPRPALHGMPKGGQVVLQFK